jgi:hypothetical protein
MNYPEVDISELSKGIFRAYFKVPEAPTSLSVGTKFGESIRIEFSPTGLYRLKTVEISEGWDIEYVQVANIIIPAFRKSPPPMCTPANRIIIHVSPHRFVDGKITHALEGGSLVVTGDVFDYKSDM